LDGRPVQAGALYTIGSLGMAVAASQVGRSVALAGSRYTLLVGANLALGAGLGAVVFAPNLLIAGVGVTAIGVGMGLTIPLYRTLLTDFAPESVRAGIVSIGSAGSRAIGVLTPIAMGSVIAITTSIVGFRLALQLASVGVGLVGGGGGLVCVLAASVAPPAESGDR